MIRILREFFGQIYANLELDQGLVFLKKGDNLKYVLLKDTIL